MARQPDPAVRRREIFGWAMFDFANSSYTTIVITVAFSVYFTKMVAAGARADALWGAAVGVTNLLVMLTSPVVGAMADDSGRKKLFLFATYITCVVATAGLYFAVPGRVVLAMALLIVSNIAFSFGENFAAAFLPEISTPRTIGRVSGLGWGIGYFGGLASLLLVRPFLKGLNLEDGAAILAPENAALFADLRLVWPITGAFFLVAGLPTFLFLRERVPRGSGRGLLEYAGAGFSRLADTLRALRHFSELCRFLVVFFVYQAGLTTVVAFAGIFAANTLGFTADELIALFILLQLSSAGGALAFGWIQDRLGGRRSIQITLVLWIAVCVASFFCQSKSLFWAIGLTAGLGIGSLQSASRALVGMFSPPEKSGEFFGFWGLAGKGAYFLGPLVFGLVSSASGSQRLALLTTAGFFIAGLAAMFFIREERGHAQAEAWHRSRAAGTESA